MEHGLWIPILAVIGTFSMIIALRYFANKERMAMIDKGLDPGAASPPKSGTGSIVAGGLLIGGGIGLLMGFFLDKAFAMDDTGYFSMLFIFGGLGLILGRKFANKETN
jgi:hypothetical protein